MEQKKLWQTPERLAAQRDEIEENIRILDMEIAEITKQLSYDRNAYKTTGESRGWDWRIQAETARKYKRIKRQQLQEEFGKMNRIIRQRRARSLENCFVEVAKQILTPEVFAHILSIATEMQEEGA